MDRADSSPARDKRNLRYVRYREKKKNEKLQHLNNGLSLNLSTHKKQIKELTLCAKRFQDVVFIKEA